MEYERLIFSVFKEIFNDRKGNIEKFSYTQNSHDYVKLKSFGFNF